MSSSNSIISIKLSLSNPVVKSDVGESDENYFPSLGVRVSSLEKLVELCDGGRDTLKDLTVKEFCDRVVKPCTEFKNNNNTTEVVTVSMCHLLNQSDHHKAMVGEATVLVSLAWSYNFLYVVDALQTHFQDAQETAVWFDLFSMNRHHSFRWDFKYYSTTYFEAIGNFKHTVTILFPWNDPILFKRAWCVWELYATYFAKGKFEIAISDKHTNDFFAQVSDESLNNMKATVRVENSKSFDDSHREQIFKAIEKKIKYSELNKIVFELLRNWMTNALTMRYAQHPNDIKCIEPLAILYSNMDEVDKARHLFEKCILLKQTLEKDNNLSQLVAQAKWYCNVGNYDKALPLCEECMERSKTELGEYHADTLRSIHTLAALHERNGEYRLAEQFYDECLQKRRSLQIIDKDTLTSMHDLATLYCRLGHYDKAKPLFEECIKESESIMEENHPDALISVHNFATVLTNLGRYGEAAPNFLKCFETFRTTLGDTNPKTLCAMQNLATIYCNLKQKDVAEGMYDEFLKKQTSLLGESNPIVMRERRHRETLGASKKAILLDRNYLMAAEVNTISSALNDSSRIGIDRLGFSSYAKSICNVLKDGETPLCVGLYAKWGSGKSFMIQLLKYNFDPTVQVSNSTRELVQWFEKDWKLSSSAQISSHPSFSGRCSYRLKLCANIFKGCWYSCASGYMFSLMRHLLFEYFNCFRETSIVYSCYHGEETNYHKIKDDDDLEKGNYEEKKEYVFIDFNAWEFSNSDELWAGLIRALYRQVETRLKEHGSDEHQNETPILKPVDWKQIWRLKKATDLLANYYGGTEAVRFRLILVVLFIACLLAVVILSALHKILIWEYLVTGIPSILSIIGGIFAICLTGVPSLRFLFKAHESVGTSRGDKIFAEASRVQDSIGFLSRVKSELEELFSFMREYEESTGIKLILVVFVDDLDRCLEGRIVKVLEAIQLLLAIPGAPILIFLAIDARIVVASIERSFERSLTISDALISGYEYMDKIVQLPFCLPDPPAEKFERFVKGCVHGVINPVEVVELLSIVCDNIKEDCLLEMPGFANIKSSWLRNRIDNYKVYANRKAAAVDVVLELCKHSTSLTPWVVIYEKETNKGTAEFEEILEFISIDLLAALRNVAFIELPPKSERELLVLTNTQTSPMQMDQKSDAGIHQVHKQAQIQQLPKLVDKVMNPMLGLQMDQKSNAGIHQVYERAQILQLPKLVDMVMKPLLPPEMSSVLTQLCSIAESNPRRLKRVLNVALIAHNVSLIQQEDSSHFNRPICRNPDWKRFSALLTKWIFLCELYPYRMSFIVQLLTDYYQMMKFNGMSCKKDWKYDLPKGVDKISEKSIWKFHFNYVLKYIHTIKSAEKLLRLDGDPELFTTLLCKDEGEWCICCNDVLSADKGFRFSLLEFSYNLNPSLAKQIALELQTTNDWSELVMHQKFEQAIHAQSTCFHSV